MKRLLIIGCGEVALAALPYLAKRYRVYALTHSSARIETLRAAGVIPLLGDLDYPNSIRHLAGVADIVLHLAPPPLRGERDSRTRNLLAALTRARMLPRRLVYLSTTGVYGDCAGERVSETRPVNPATARARRRVDAEQMLRAWGVRWHITVSILRVPGIYGPGRLPLNRLAEGTPALNADDDVYTNHIHIEDLARATVRAITRSTHSRVYNVSDDTQMRMADYFDLVATRFGLPLPPRVPRAEAQRRLPATLLSFMSESRRITNTRMKRELGYALRYPHVSDGIEASTGIP